MKFGRKMHLGGGEFIQIDRKLSKIAVRTISVLLSSLSVR